MAHLLAALPEYDTIPGPLWMIVILHLLTLTLHFVAMNFLLGGIVIVLFGRIENRWQNPVVQRYLKLFPTLMAATVTLAVAPLLFSQLTYGGPLYAASIVSGWLWLLVPIVVMVGYYFLYGSAFAKEGNPKVKVWLFVALLCLLYVSVMQSSVFSMAERPDVQKSVYEGNQSGFALNPNVGDWIWRWLHMVTGAVTVGAFLVGVLGRADEQVFKAAKTVHARGADPRLAHGRALPAHARRCPEALHEVQRHLDADGRDRPVARLAPLLLQEEVLGGGRDDLRLARADGLHAPRAAARGAPRGAASRDALRRQGGAAVGRRSASSSSASWALSTSSTGCSRPTSRTAPLNA